MHAHPIHGNTAKSDSGIQTSIPCGEWIEYLAYLECEWYEEADCEVVLTERSLSRNDPHCDRSRHLNLLLRLVVARDVLEQTLEDKQTHEG